MQLNDLLKLKKFDPKGVLVQRHRPSERDLRKVFPWLAADKPDIFNAYQQAQFPIVEKAMTRAQYVASFIGLQPGSALFIGLYKIVGSKPISYEEYWRIPANIELKRFGMRGLTSERSTVLWFDLRLSKFYAEWKGKLVVQWPGLERSWWRWADRNEMLVSAIHEESILEAAMPDWNELSLTWSELAVLPTKWKAALAQWRGIYYILDKTDGKGYVGAAYGADNLFGRWRNYSASGHGGNRQLRTRQPSNLHFSILQRVSPDMEAEAVIRLEGTWKDRLHTREFGLNEN